jgi:hypothetical protein
MRGAHLGVRRPLGVQGSYRPHGVIEPYEGLGLTRPHGGTRAHLRASNSRCGKVLS